MNIKDIPIILHTKDSYSEFWDYWWLFFNKHCNHPVIFVTETKKPRFNNKVSVFYTGFGEWGERLNKILDHLSSIEYVFYMQEDFWPTQSFPFNQNIIDIAIANDFDCWRMCEMSYLYSIIESNLHTNTFRFHQNSLYTLSHQFSLWNRSFLRKFIQNNQTPWENEVTGSKQMNCTTIHKIFFTPHKWYNEVVNKGKIKPNGLEMIKNEK